MGHGHRGAGVLRGGLSAVSGKRLRGNQPCGRLISDTGACESAGRRPVAHAAGMRISISAPGTPQAAAGGTFFPTHIRSCCLRSLPSGPWTGTRAFPTQTRAFLPTPPSVGERRSLRAGPCSQASPSLPGSRPQGRLFCLQPLRPPCFLSNRLRFHPPF